MFNYNGERLMMEKLILDFSMHSNAKMNNHVEVLMLGQFADSLQMIQHTHYSIEHHI